MIRITQAAARWMRRYRSVSHSPPRLAVTARGLASIAADLAARAEVTRRSQALPPTAAHGPLVLLPAHASLLPFLLRQ
eukprot:52499-Eustigmatos_ZCMA.PRE.1